MNTAAADDGAALGEPPPQPVATAAAISATATPRTHGARDALAAVDTLIR
jgi:hypothetical protein